MQEWWRRTAHGPNHKWWALVTVAIGTFMATLDSSIVNISLPAILSYFRSDLATIQWVVLAYLLTSAMALGPCGRMKMGDTGCGRGEVVGY